MTMLLVFLVSPNMVAAASVGSPSVSGGSGVIPEFFFQIPIGGLRSVIVCETGSDGKLACPGIAKYVQVVYRFLVGFAAVLAVLALTWGGVRWLMSGGDSSAIQEAKKIMGNALIGLLLALGSYALLFTLGKQFVEYKPISIRRIQLIILNITPTTISAGGTSATYDVNRFAAYGFPPPNTEPDKSGKKMEGEALRRWNKYKDLAMKASVATRTDIGFIGMWPLLENSFDTFMDNCADTDHNPNTPCASWGSNWQVGLGIHPGNMPWAYEDGVSAMYGNTNDATVQNIGQSVLDTAKAAGRPLTLVSDPFPTISLNSTIDAAKNGDQNARLLIATLSKDPALGLYLVGAHFGSKDVGKEPKSEMATRMNNWPPAGAYTPQRISNLIKSIYDAK